jgi:AcrR family transcriptional regulator
MMGRERLNRGQEEHAMTSAEPQVSTSVASRIDAIYRESGFEDDSLAKRPNKRGQQTHERLLVAATACFTDYGYTRTRISDIVHRAGTSQGNFYRHFDSLDAIFLAVLRPGLIEIADSSAGHSRNATELDSLIAANTTYLHSYTRHRHVLRLLREAAAASPNDGFQTLWFHLRDAFVSRTRKWLQRLSEAGEIDDVDAEVLAETLGCLTEQLAYVHIGLARTTPRPERIDELGRALGEAWYRLLPRTASA